MSTPNIFLPTAGEPIFEWEQQSEGIEASIEAVSRDIFTERRKLTMLKHCLGAEERSVLKHLLLI